MKILNVSSFCSDKTFNDLFIKLKKKPQTSIQKFYNLFINGLILNGNEVYSLTNRQIYTDEKKLFFKSYKESISNVCTFLYLPVITISLINQLCLSLCTIIFMILYFIKNKREVIVFCDMMRFWISIPTLLIAKLFRIKVYVIVADIPQMYNMHKKGNISFLRRISKLIYSKFSHYYDGYILFSKFMNDKVNIKKKPYIVIEGMVDFNDKIEKNKIQNKIEKNIFMYSGGLYEKFGVKCLVDSFIYLKNENIELWLCGQGELEEYILSLKVKNIKYLGYLSNKKVIRLQKKADFLVNPRFSDEEYTKYSFPSKILEYMLSGTPVISTKLKGIPDEYFDFLITIDKENIEGFIEIINRVCEFSIEKRRKIGSKSRSFVLNEKNNKYQSKKIIDWIFSINQIGR